MLLYAYLPVKSLGLFVSKMAEREREREVCTGRTLLCLSELARRLATTNAAVPCDPASTAESIVTKVVASGHERFVG